MSSAFDTILEMERGYSILLSFGEDGRKLKRKMRITGFICRVLLFFIFNPVFLVRAHFFPNVWNRRKATAVKVARLFFPFRSEGYKMTPTQNGQIFIINHPTLNDPICALLYALEIYPDREIIIPVNIPWFENVCSYRSKLLNIGINLVPILSPETAKRLGSNDNVSRVQTAFMRNYITEFTNTLSRGGFAVVAQQATRRRYLFSDYAQSVSGDGILSTISLIISGIRRAKLSDRTYFTPIGVVSHTVNADPKLNLFRKYTLTVGEPILASELIAVKNKSRRPADLHMLHRLMEVLPAEYHFEN